MPSTTFTEEKVPNSSTLLLKSPEVAAHRRRTKEPDDDTLHPSSEVPQTSGGVSGFGRKLERNCDLGIYLLHGWQKVSWKALKGLTPLFLGAESVNSLSEMKTSRSEEKGGFNQAGVFDHMGKLCTSLWYVAYEMKTTRS